MQDFSGGQLTSILVSSA